LRILQIALKKAQSSQKNPLYFKELGIYRCFFFGLAHPLLYVYRAQIKCSIQPKPKLIDLRRNEMLTIKDLDVSRELDAKTMSAVRGGWNTYQDYKSDYSQPSHDSSYQPTYDSSYQPTYDSSYQPSYDSSYQPSSYPCCGYSAPTPKKYY
jgi:hypothetical protein